MGLDRGLNSSSTNPLGIDDDDYTATTRGAQGPQGEAGTSTQDYIDKYNTVVSSAAGASVDAANAATSATASANTATASSTSAANSATSATNSANSATSAATSASTATTKATQSANSATSSASSASTATTQVALATTQANTATTKASEASTSATNSANSATASATSATASASSASSASTSATTATTKASESATSASAAAVSAAAALVSENNTANKLPLAGGTLTGDVSHGDNVKAKFGTGDDLQIYHSGTGSYITDSGTGSLYIQGQNLLLQNNDGSKAYLSGIGDVTTLYHGAGTKLATTATGIDVTGQVTADGLTVDGDGLIQANIGAKLEIKSTDNFINANEIIGSVDFISADYNHTAQPVKVQLEARAFNNLGSSDLYISTTNAATKADRIRVSYNGDISFYEDTGTTPKMVWSASNESLGIGTANPNAPLHVTASGTNPAATFFNSGNTADITSYSARAGLQFIGYQSDGGSPYLKTSAIIANGDGTAPSELQLWTKANGSSSAVERLRISADGNVLVGKTVANQLGTVGTELQADGQLYVTSNAQDTVRLNRLASDGTLIDFRKNSTTVGSIGTKLGGVYIADTAIGLRFDSGGVDDIIPCDSVGNVADDSITLGSTGGRFKDLYLSGIVRYGDNVYAGKGSAITGSFGANDFLISPEAVGSKIGFRTEGTERMRIDSSGDLLVGKTTSDLATIGQELKASGASYFTRSNQTVMFANRLASDGDIISLRKDGTTVSSIGSYNGVPYIGYAGGTGGGIMFNGLSIEPTSLGATRTNGNNDIGSTNYKWKDLHLSGGVYLGGTGAANKLDDYESGTWTGTVGGGTTNPTVEVSGAGTYVKVGKVVTVTWRKSDYSNVGASGQIIIRGLPFVSLAETVGTGWGGRKTSPLYPYMPAGSNQISMLTDNGSGNNWSDNGTGTYTSICMTYFTNA